MGVYMGVCCIGVLGVYGYGYTWVCVCMWYRCVVWVCVVLGVLGMCDGCGTKIMTCLNVVDRAGAEAAECSPLRGQSSAPRGSEQPAREGDQVQCVAGRQHGPAGEDGGHGVRAAGGELEDARAAPAERAVGARQRPDVSWSSLHH